MAMSPRTRRYGKVETPESPFVQGSKVAFSIGMAART